MQTLASTELTRAQQAFGSVWAGLQGYDRSSAGSYQTYRAMGAHPTLALARAVVAGPVLAGAWTVEADASATAEQIGLVRSVLLPMRTMLLTAGLRALDYGWQPFEKVWQVDGSCIILRKIKPLLPDLTEIVCDENGAFAGLRQDRVHLPAEKCLVISMDVEAGDLYGRSRHENVRDIWSRWQQIDQQSAQLSNKAAAIIPQIHFPQGTSVDANGRTVSNFEAAMSILRNLSQGRGVAVPNLYANTDDPRTDAELAGKSAWVISFLEAGSAAASVGTLTDRQRYYDTLMVRGWLRPERAVLEATLAGSRADAETHAHFGIRESEAIDNEIARQINWYVVDDLLAMNFGHKARGKVWIKPVPLVDEKRAVFERMFTALTADTESLRDVLNRCDMNAVLDAMAIPRRGEVKLNPSGGTNDE
jgi:hypothetical protein